MDSALSRSSAMDFDPASHVNVRDLDSSSEVEGMSSESSTYHSIMRNLMIKLIILRELKTDEPLALQLFDALAAECLAISTKQRLPPLSLICGDATPLQFCVSLSREKASAHELRYITEVCKSGMLLPARTALAKGKIPTILKLVGAEKLQSQIDALLGLLLPQSRLLPDHPMLGIWFGVRHSRGLPPTLTLYLKLLWDLGDPWIMSSSALHLIGIKNFEESLEEIRRCFDTQCRPTCIGIECSSRSFGKAKLYLRGFELKRSDVLGYLEDRGYVDFERDYVQFHKVFVGERNAYVPRSVVLSMELSRRESQGLKVEIGPRHYVKDDLEVHRRINELACQLLFETTPYEQMLNLISGRKLVLGSMHYHDVVGIGYDPIEGPRLTIYLRPHMRRYNLMSQNSANP